MTNTFFWGLAQLESAARVERKVPMFNPRPAGVIQSGSASEAILQVLRASPDTFFTHGALLRLTGRTHAAVSWGLKYLREQNLIRTVGDGARNPKYLRYAAAVGARDVEVAKPRTQESEERMADDEAPMPGAELSRLQEVRRGGHQGLPAVADELRAVPGGHGIATEPGALAGQTRHLEALHAGELSLDGAGAANEPAPVLPQGDRGGPDTDSSGGLTVAGTADQEHGPAPLGSRLQSGEPEGDQALQALALADTPGRNIALAIVGAAHRPTSQPVVATDQEGHAYRTGADSPSIPQSTRDLFHSLETIRAAA